MHRPPRTPPSETTLVRHTEEAEETVVSSLPGARVRPGIGDVIGGKYRLERLIGEGGMGYVYAARHEELDELFAVKVLEVDREGSTKDAQRMLREARATMRLKNEHVVRVVDASAGDTHPYMVMELLDGIDLEQLVARAGPLPITEAVDYVLQAGEALAEAHALGMVHRDVKPANLILTKRADGRALVKVVDFGISKSTQDRPGAKNHKTTSATEVGAVFGSPAYMSPEQLRSTKDVDARTDVWSTGVVLFELLTGELPFDGETRVALSIAVATAPPARLAERRPDVPPELEQIVLACLQKMPDHRVPSIAELASRLRPFASAEGAASCETIARLTTVRASMPSLPNLPAPPPPSTSSPAPSLGFTRTEVHPHRSRPLELPRWAIGAAASALLVVVVALGVTLERAAPSKGGRAAGREAASAIEASGSAPGEPTAVVAAAAPPAEAPPIPPAAAPAAAPTDLELPSDPMAPTAVASAAAPPAPSGRVSSTLAPTRRPPAAAPHARDPKLSQRR